MYSSHGSAAEGTAFVTRFNKFGKWSGIIGENIAYGYPTARDIVVQWIVDVGVASKGHRLNSKLFYTTNCKVLVFLTHLMLCGTSFEQELQASRYWPWSSQSQQLHDCS